MALNCSRKPCALLNVIMALAVLVIGISLFIVGGAFQLDGFFQTEGKLKDYSDGIFLALVIMGSISILGAICGCASGWIPHKVLSMLFGLLLTPIWIVFLVLMLTTGGIMLGSEDGLNSFCAGGDGGENSQAFKDVFQDYVTAIDDKLVSYSNRWMCSDQCPCSSEFQTFYQQQVSETEAK